MDVYLVPVGQDRHELYCEVPDEPEDTSPDEGQRGFFTRLRLRFREMLAEAERERKARPFDVAQGRPEPVEGRTAPTGLMHRIKTRSMRWVAESIAEQRLLWYLRGQTTAALHYPDDLDETRAMASLRAQLSADYERHRRWLVIDAVLFLLSGLLMLVPGPNVIAYYFAFRLVGHYLSMRGARQGLTGITWRAEKSPLLSELRRAINLEPSAREQRVQDVAVRLRLEHLPTFFERMAVTS
jgi:Mitochondrial K+-H+ exchange-related